MSTTTDAGMPTISVVLPCFNARQYLREAVESALRQTRKPLEIIVVDDCSTDGSLETVADLPITLVTNTSNRGEAASRNAGIALARGDYVATLDADDIWLPEHLEKVARLLDEFRDVAVTCASIQMFGARTDTVRPGFEENSAVSLFRRVFTGCAIPHPTTILRRSIVGQHPYTDNGSTSYSPDFTLWLGLSSAHPFACTHDVTVHYRVHEGQLSRNRHKQLASKYAARRLAMQGRPDAAELEEILRSCWQQDLKDAWNGRNLESVKTLRDIAVAPEFSSPWDRMQAGAAMAFAPIIWPVIDRAKSQVKQWLGRR